VAWDTQGNIFISDGYINARVAKYDKNGDWVKSFGTPGSGPGQFNTPHTIAAGNPLEALPTIETITVPADMVAGKGRTFVLKIQGESMIGEQIREGDYVIIEERQVARDGETVVALVDGSDATLKRIYREGAVVRLQPSHPTMAPIVVAADRVSVQGVVVGLIRKY
jgi:repressor LexA